jgi:hypothetical protein
LFVLAKHTQSLTALQTWQAKIIGPGAIALAWHPGDGHAAPDRLSWLTPPHATPADDNPAHLSRN